MAGSTLAFLPPFLLYVALQKKNLWKDCASGSKGNMKEVRLSKKAKKEKASGEKAGGGKAMHLCAAKCKPRGECRQKGGDCARRRVSDGAKPPADNRAERGS